MHEPIQWTIEQLNEDTATGRNRFRAERLEEPLELYSEFFDAFVPIFERLIAQIGQLADSAPDPNVLEGIMNDADARMAFPIPDRPLQFRRTTSKRWQMPRCRQQLSDKTRRPRAG